MNERFSRTALLLGEEGVKQLARAHVAIFGIGGVGSYAAEAVARSGVGAITLCDHDRISLSNVNRQLPALESTLGLLKTDVMKQRILDINPKAQVVCRESFFGPDTAETFDFSCYDAVIDAVDTVTAKLLLIERAAAAGCFIVSSMGAGNKKDPSRFRASDISQTSVCPLARVMRRELKKRGIEQLRVVWSDEPPLSPGGQAPTGPSGKPVPGSVAFVPPVAGLILAGEVVNHLANKLPE